MHGRELQVRVCEVRTSPGHRLRCRVSRRGPGAPSPPARFAGLWPLTKVSGLRRHRLALRRPAWAPATPCRACPLRVASQGPPDGLLSAFPPSSHSSSPNEMWSPTPGPRAPPAECRRPSPRDPCPGRTPKQAPESVTGSPARPSPRGLQAPPCHPVSPSLAVTSAAASQTRLDPYSLVSGSASAEAQTVSVPSGCRDESRSLVARNDRSPLSHGSGEFGTRVAGLEPGRQQVCAPGRGSRAHLPLLRVARGGCRRPLPEAASPGLRAGLPSASSL